MSSIPNQLLVRLDKGAQSGLDHAVTLSAKDCALLSDLDEFWTAKDRGATAKDLADYRAAREIMNNAHKKPHSWWDDESNVSYIKTIERLLGA